jgi:hypothetical protein
LAALEGLNLRETTWTTWDNTVSKRDWVAAPKTGRVVDTTEPGIITYVKPGEHLTIADLPRLESELRNQFTTVERRHWLWGKWGKISWLVQSEESVRYEDNLAAPFRHIRENC